MRRLALAVTICGLAASGCGFFDDAADPFDRLDAAEVELVALGREAFGSAPVEVQHIANCIDQPASVWASWNTGDGMPEDLYPTIRRTASATGWDVLDRSGSPVARRMIDGTAYALLVEPANEDDDGSPDVILRAQWSDDDPC